MSNKMFLDWYSIRDSLKEDFIPLDLVDSKLINKLNQIAEKIELHEQGIVDCIKAATEKELSTGSTYSITFEKEKFIYNFNVRYSKDGKSIIL